MEQSFVSCIQQTVKVLAENYEFDYEEALALFGSDDLKVETNLGKTKGVKAVGSAPKRTKPKFPLPFTGEVFDDCCRAIVFNSGLFTQCLKEPKPDSQKSLCQTCEKQAEKTPLGVPPLGYISDRLDRGDDWADPKGRRPVPYTKVMKAKKFTQEEVMAEASQYDMTLDLSVFDDTDSEKRGRKKGGNKTEAKSVFGEDDDDDDDLLGALIQEVKDSESEVSEKSKTSKSSKKSKEEREAEKLEKASQKSENDLMKAEEKRMRELKKEEDRIAKEHEKRAKEQQKEALRLLKEAKEEEKRLIKEAKEQEKKEKEAAKAAKEAAKAAKADEKRSPVKNIKEEKMLQPEVVKEEQLEELEEVEPGSPLDPPPVEEEEVEPGSPLDPPPVEEPVVEEEEVVIPIQAVKPKMKKFKGPNGVSYVADPENIVYRKDAPTVRVGVLTPDGLELDEEEEEDLSDIE